ncbi:MAG: mechanosensitive ion channel family protein [Leptolyngbyaceae cyanobacterium]
MNHRRRRHRSTGRRWCYGLLGGAIALWCVLVPSGALWAQADSLPPADESSPPPALTLPETDLPGSLQNLAPSEWSELFDSPTTETDIAPIYLDGRALFDVAAPTESVGTLPAVERAQEIEQRLVDIAQEFVSPERLETLEVSSRIDLESNQPIIEVNGSPLMTVTYLDARLDGSNSLTVRAAQMVDQVADAIQRYSHERQPEFLWQQVRWLLATLLITLLASFAISHFAQDLSQRRQQLQQGAVTSPAEASVTAPTLPPTLSTVRLTLLKRQKINSLGIFQQFLQLLQGALWLGSGLLMLGFFPYTRWLQPLAVSVMRLPIRFVLVSLVAYGLIRFSSLWIDRLFLAFQGRTTATVERSQRLVLRLSTFSQVIKGIVAFAIAGIALLIMLSLLGIRVAPLLAGAGLLGFAISFASQSLIKDIINGFLVLVEDQYGVGDVITVRNLSGLVETMNLRITQLRATDGQLITIPNGQIDIVQNLSKEWSRVDLMIPIGLTANIDQALAIVEKEANQLRQDEIWGSLILEPPLLLGVDELSHAGATIRIWIKTQPLKQWDVAREYRRRLKIAFEAAQIPLGVPQQVVQMTHLGAADGGLAIVEPATDSTAETPPHPTVIPSPQRLP